ncbi:unnamed protein product, partial [Oppiella nova]
MAPEVFEGKKYTEKCDVYSWAIILWEVLARRIPFDWLENVDLVILLAAHRGKRPPLLHNCPQVIENIMTKCWSKDPAVRPSMAEVVDLIGMVAQEINDANDYSTNGSLFECQSETYSTIKPKIASKPTVPVNSLSNPMYDSVTTDEVLDYIVPANVSRVIDDSDTLYNCSQFLQPNKFRRNVSQESTHESVDKSMDLSDSPSHVVK